MYLFSYSISEKWPTHNKHVHFGTCSSKLNITLCNLFFFFSAISLLHNISGTNMIKYSKTLLKFGFLFTSILFWQLMLKKLQPFFFFNGTSLLCHKIDCSFRILKNSILCKYMTCLFAPKMLFALQEFIDIYYKYKLAHWSSGQSVQSQVVSYQKL